MHRRSLSTLATPLFGALSLTWASLAAAEPPAVEAAPQSTTAPAAPEAPATASPESRPTVPAPAVSAPTSATSPEATRPTVPAPPRPPPVEPGHHLEPPGTVAEYDDAFVRLEHEVKTTTGRRQAIALADLAQVERWYDEDVHRNGGTLALGIVLLAAHPALLVGGGAAAMDGQVWSSSRGTSEAQIAAFPLIIGGLVALGAGVALTISGAARRVRTPSEREDWRSQHAPRTSASPVTLTFGPGVLAGAF